MLDNFNKFTYFKKNFVVALIPLHYQKILRGPHKTSSRTSCGPRAAIRSPLLYNIFQNQSNRKGTVLDLSLLEPQSRSLRLDVKIMKLAFVFICYEDCMEIIHRATQGPDIIGPFPCYIYVTIAATGDAVMLSVSASPI